MLERLREGLLAGGDDVRLLTSSAGSAAGRSADYVAYGSTRLAEQAFLQLFNPFAYRTMRRALAEFRPDAVYLGAFLPHLSPAVLAALDGVPAGIVVTDYKPICPRSTKLLPDGSPCTEPAGEACRRNGCVGRVRGARERPRIAAVRRGLGRGVRITTISRWMRGELALNGFDADLVSPPVPAPAAGFARRPGTSPLFVYAGRLAPVKGVELLLDAFAELRRRYPEARLRIVGDGPSRDRIAHRVRELRLGESVTMEVAMARDWFGELEPAWALIVPSIFREPLGLVAIEAILHDVPVIAPREGGLSESVVDGATGLLIKARDQGALRDAMESICRGDAFPSRTVDPAAREELRDRHDPAGYVERTRSMLVGAGAAA